MSVSKSVWRLTFLVVVALLDLARSLDVECGYESQRNMVSCRCLGNTQSVGFEDLSDVVNDYVRDRFSNLVFHHVQLRDCDRVMITLNLR